MLSLELKRLLERQRYKIVGKHSAVKLCTWTRKSLLDKDVCYKEKFYNIKSHACCQMTPSLICPNSCEYCWREMSMLIGDKLNEIDDPKEIIEGCVKAHKKLINGFPSNPKLNKNKFKEAQNPKYFAISLAGEPTIYDKLNELIDELKDRKKCSFLVSNGLFPDKIKKLNKLPTQLYISLSAPTKELYYKIDKPIFNDAWDRLNKTLELLPSLDTRIALRITAIKNRNMCNEEDYVKLIRKANPKFVEIKSYMFVGSSKERLQLENMPEHNEIQEFAEKISKLSGLPIIDEKEESRVVLLGKNKNRKLDF